MRFEHVALQRFNGMFIRPYSMICDKCCGRSLNSNIFEKDILEHSKSSSPAKKTG